MLDDGFDFSFSGLKTAVVNYVRRHPGRAPSPTSSASFQEAVVDVLVAKLSAGAAEAGAPTLVLGGGVAANSRLRTRLVEAAEATGRRVFLPPLELCTDNGAMIAATAWWRLAGRRPDAPRRRRRPEPPAALGRLTPLAGPACVVSTHADEC